MVPHIARRGRSFKGAGLYYLHDRKARTAERIPWTYTHNLPTDDPHKAIACMIHTACNTDRLKQEAGISRTGRRPKQGPVYCYSLAWHPEQSPEQDHMIGCALQTLEVLNLTEHECLVVAHSDTPHKHVHCIVSLIHPLNGKQANPYRDRVKLSAWALDYEKKHGPLYCHGRVEKQTLMKDSPMETFRAARSAYQMEKEREERLSFQRLQDALDSFERAIIAKEQRGAVDANKERDTESRDALRRRIIALHLEQDRRAQLTAWEREQQARRIAHDAKMRAQYGLDELEQNINKIRHDLDQNKNRLMFRLSGRQKTLETRLDELEQNRTNIDQRMREQSAALEKDLALETALFTEDLEARTVEDVLNDIAEIERYNKTLDRQNKERTQDQQQDQTR